MMSAHLVREMRQRAGLTQAELARRLKTSQPTVARWERATTAPSFERLREVARACGLDLQPWLLSAVEVDHDLRLALPLADLTPAERLVRYDQTVRQFERLREIGRRARATA